jgi:hypothetical protein
MMQRGAMYEINLLIWPALYGYTGWLWGAQAGWPVTIAIAAVVAGFVVGVSMMNINPYVLGPLVAWAALLLPWFIDAGTWRWVALALCLSALPVIAIGLILNKRWV